MTPVRAYGSIGELCIALAHRWEPERLFVIFTAYFDESDTHGSAPTLIMSTYLGHAYQWRRFETKLARLQRDFGFKVFHGKDFRARRGEFSGWADEKCSALIGHLTDLVSADLTRGLSVHLEHARYIGEYRSPPHPPKMHFDSQYGVCFRACLGGIFEALENRGNRYRLNVVIESGHTNVRDCIRIWDEIKEGFRLAGMNLLGDITISSKEDSAPLMVADMLAYAHSRMRVAVTDGTINAESMRVDPSTTKGAIAYLELKEDALAKLKADRAEYARIKHEAYQAAGRAKKGVAALAASSS